MPCLIFILSLDNAIRPLHIITNRNHYRYDGAKEMKLLAERSSRSDNASKVMADFICGCTRRFVCCILLCAHLDNDYGADDADNENKKSTG